MAHGNINESGNKGPQGYYEPLYPHELGPRALTHDEMDYNLDLIGEIIKGYRVMGNGPEAEMDLTNDVEKVLKLYKVTSSDTTLINEGASIGDYVWVPGVATGGSGGDAITTANVTAQIAAGAINIGDVVPAGTTLQQFVEQLLLTTYYPTFIPPSFDLNINNYVGLREVGEQLDVTLVFDFDRGYIVGKLVNQIWNPSVYQDFRAGAASYYTLNGSQVSNNSLTIPNYNVVLGMNSFTGSVTYLQGPQPTDSDGDNYSTPLNGGTSPTQSTQFEGVYPIFLGNAANGETKRALVSHSVTEVLCDQPYNETSTLRHRIAISNAMIGTRTVTWQQFNILTNNWVTLDPDEFVASQTTRVVQGNTVNYTLYTKDSIIGGYEEYKVVFS